MLMWRNGLWLAVEVPVCPPGPAGLRPFTGALTRCAGKSQGTSALWGSSPAVGTRDFHDRKMLVAIVATFNLLYPNGNTQ